MFVCTHVLIGLFHPVTVCHCEHANVGGHKEKTGGVHEHSEGGKRGSRAVSRGTLPVCNDHELS